VKIALVLGGGGTRGFAHIGVIRILKKEKIPISLIIGTSMGAVIGGAYALRPDIDLLERRLLEIVSRKEIFDIEILGKREEPLGERRRLRKIASFARELYGWNMTAFKKWLIPSDKVERLLGEVVGDGTFSETKIPFACCAADLKTGEEVILREGLLLPSIMASSAIPGVFPPVTLNGRTLVDGGVVGGVPVDAAKRLGADFIIGVNVEGALQPKELKYGIDILLRADSICAHELNRMKLLGADIVVTPRVSHISWAHFSKAKECIVRGEIATLRDVSRIKGLLKRRRAWIFLKRFIPLKRC
jgi:NTE family protein